MGGFRPRVGRPAISQRRAISINFSFNLLLETAPSQRCALAQSLPSPNCLTSRRLRQPSGASRQKQGKSVSSPCSLRILQSETRPSPEVSRDTETLVEEWSLRKFL